MKTAEHVIIFRKKDVREFVKIVDDPNPIYETVENAQKLGFPTIPLPPTMPMIAYKWIDIPWTLNDPVIHRSQSCVLHQVMYIDTDYFATVSKTERRLRNRACLVTQTLEIFDRNGKLCFEGISQLMAGEN
jgi:hypothetical protein